MAYERVYSDKLHTLKNWYATGMPLSVVTKDALYKGYKPWPWPNVLVDKNISEFGKTLFTLHLFYNSHTHIVLFLCLLTL